jgi:hypothetical protein
MGNTPSYIQFEPGQFVRLPAASDWGIGQVQSAIGGMITVNFDHAGKQVININVARLIHADPSPDML